MLFRRKLSASRSRIPSALGLLVLLVSGGCLQMREELIIHRNGSARLILHYSLPTEAASLAERALSEIAPGGEAPGPAWCFNREVCAAHFRAIPLDLERHQVYTRKGRRHAVLECRADDLNQALGTGPLESFRLSETAAGRLKLRIVLPRIRALPEHAKRLPKDLRLELVVTTPTPVVRSNGIQTEDRTVVWTVTGQTLQDGKLSDFTVEFEALAAAPPTDEDPP